MYAGLEVGTPAMCFDLAERPAAIKEDRLPYLHQGDGVLSVFNMAQCVAHTALPPDLGAAVAAFFVGISADRPDTYPSTFRGATVQIPQGVAKPYRPHAAGAGHGTPRHAPAAGASATPVTQRASVPRTDSQAARRAPPSLPSQGSLRQRRMAPPPPSASVASASGGNVSEAEMEMDASIPAMQVDDGVVGVSSASDASPPRGVPPRGKVARAAKKVGRQPLPRTPPPTRRHSPSSASDDAPPPRHTPKRASPKRKSTRM